MLPEAVAREIHSYRTLLDAANPSPNGLITISATSLSNNDQDLFTSAAAFLQLGFLAPINGAPHEIKDALDDLVSLYNFSLKLVISEARTGGYQAHRLFPGSYTGDLHQLVSWLTER